MAQPQQIPLTLGLVLLACCEGAQQPVPATKPTGTTSGPDCLSWKPPQQVGHLVLSELPGFRKGWESFLSERSLSSFSTAAVAVHPFVDSHEDVYLRIFVIQHSKPAWRDHEFMGIWYKIYHTAKSASFYYSRTNGNLVIHADIENESERAIAWTTSEDATIWISYTNSVEADVRAIVPSLLDGFPSTLQTRALGASPREFLEHEVDKLLDYIDSEELRTGVMLQLSALTYFLPQGTARTDGDIKAAYLEEFPKWWRAHKKQSQEEWLRTRIESEIAAIDDIQIESYPTFSSKVLPALEQTVGLSLPPMRITSQEELNELIEHWKQFWQTSETLRQEHWIRPAIDIWLSYISRLVRNGIPPKSEYLALHYLLAATGKLPEPLSKIPQTKGTEFDKAYFQDIQNLLTEIENWWSTERSIVESRELFKPFFEELGVPTFRPLDR